MNIFILDHNPILCAQFHCDKHVVKMLLESVQMLSTASHLAGLKQGYSPTHVNHPCTIWTRTSVSNWLWLRTLTYALHSEWQYRFRHAETHKSIAVLNTFRVPQLPYKDLTPFAQAMPIQYKSEDPIESYRNYYVNEKTKILQYTKREVPLWMKNKLDT